jgi:hypothetical protein
LIKQYTSILAFIGAISVGILQVTQAHDRWTLERVTKVTVEAERNLYKYTAGPYTDEALKRAGTKKTKDQLYVERVMRIIINKFNRFYAIGRPSGTEEGGDEDHKKILGQRRKQNQQQPHRKIKVKTAAKMTELHDRS